jgi:hypothetical protein
LTESDNTAHGSPERALQTNRNVKEIMADEIRARIEEHFGFLPPYFTPVLKSPGLFHSMWGRTCAGYLNSPLPPVFRETLLARLARFCSQPSPLVCHCTVLLRFGLKPGEILDVLEAAPRCWEGGFTDDLQALGSDPILAASWPPPNSARGMALLRCSILIFQNRQSSRHAQTAIRRLIGTDLFDELLAFLSHANTYMHLVEEHPGPQVETIPQAWKPFVALLREEPRLTRVFRRYGNPNRSGRDPAVRKSSNSGAGPDFQPAKAAADDSRRAHLGHGSPPGGTPAPLATRDMPGSESAERELQAQLAGQRITEAPLRKSLADTRAQAVELLEANKALVAAMAECKDEKEFWRNACESSETRLAAAMQVIESLKAQIARYENETETLWNDLAKLDHRLADALRAKEELEMQTGRDEGAGGAGKNNIRSEHFRQAARA